MLMISKCSKWEFEEESFYQSIGVCSWIVRIKVNLMIKCNSIGLMHKKEVVKVVIYKIFRGVIPKNFGNSNNFCLHYACKQHLHIPTSLMQPSYDIPINHSFICEGI